MMMKCLSRLPWTVFIVCILCTATAATTSTTHAVLSNHVQLPLVGLGVGYMTTADVTLQVPKAIDSHGFALLDTTATHNATKRLVVEDHAQVLGTLLQQSHGSNDDNDMHVLTKVWYTHLGYARTVLAVQELHQALIKDGDNNNNDHHHHIQMHVLLQWPRCQNDVSWMHCQEDEAALPSKVKTLGPPPHLDENAFLDSWHALQDLYASGLVASIGVSNFELDDLQLLQQHTHFLPHMIQLNVHSILFDPWLVEYCRQHNIHIQAYNVMNGIVNGRDKAPYAFEALWMVAQEVQPHYPTKLTPALVLLKWLTQQGISVVPRTTQPARLASQSPHAIATIPQLNAAQVELVEQAARALLEKHDLEQPIARFVNKHATNTSFNLFWKDVKTGKEVPVMRDLEPGAAFDTQTFPGHVFVAVHSTSSGRRREYTVSASYGQAQEWIIDEL